MPERIQRKRTKGWRIPPNTVYVGRPSKWGNPYSARSFGSPYERLMPETEAQYRQWAVDYYRSRLGSIAPRLRELRGKNLACWCRLDQPCHADVLLEIANA